MLLSYEKSTEYIVENNYGISTISRPENHTVLFIMKKIEEQLKNLYDCEDCFVFFQEGISLPDDLMERHTFCRVENAATAFSLYVRETYGKKRMENRKRKYRDREGSLIGENVSIGEGTHIEPGCLIDHDVSIGRNCTILFGAVLRNCRIGDNCTIYEHAMIGNEPFNYYEENGRLVRTIPVGDVVVRDDVEIGAYSVIDRGTTSHTIIKEDVKMDANVRIGHDAVVGRGVEISGPAGVGAFCEIGEKASIFSAKIIKRVKIGRNSIVGFHSGVIKDVPDDVKVFGYPARIIER